MSKYCHNSPLRSEGLLRSTDNNRSRNKYSRELLLTQIACRGGKYVVGVASDQTNGTDDHCQNHG